MKRVIVKNGLREQLVFARTLSHIYRLKCISSGCSFDVPLTYWNRWEAWMDKQGQSNCWQMTEQMQIWQAKYISFLGLFRLENPFKTFGRLKKKQISHLWLNSPITITTQQPSHWAWPFTFLPSVPVTDNQTLACEIPTDHQQFLPACFQSHKVPNLRKTFSPC